MNEYTADQIFERHYLRMRPRLVELTRNDEAALRSFDRCYRRLLEMMTGEVDPRTVKEVDPYWLYASLNGLTESEWQIYRRRRVLTGGEARRLLEKEFDDCLPVGTPAVEW
jgi:hypothetical protein